MGQFFGSLYCFPFEDFFGLDLADYLWGLSAKDVITNQFIGIGLWMSGISFAIAVLFYYIVNHPRLCNWWGVGNISCRKCGYQLFHRMAMGR